MRIGGLLQSARVVSRLLCIAGIVAACVAAFDDVAYSKTPGEKHCYRGVCHRVKTVGETAAFVGRAIDLNASHYDSPDKDRFNTGVYTSSGVKFDASDATATSSSNFPDGTELLVWNPKNGHAVHVRVVDFGPFLADRTLDLTRAAAEKLGFAQHGIAKLRITVIAPPPLDEPKYRAGRIYRKVGGFIGVYREHELTSLTSLLIHQARLRREPRGIIQAAISTPYRTQLFDTSPGASANAVQDKTPGHIGTANGRYVELNFQNGPPTGRYVQSAKLPAPSTGITSQANSSSSGQSRDLQRVAVLGPNAGLETMGPVEKRLPNLKGSRSTVTETLVFERDRLAGFAVNKASVLVSRPVRSWLPAPTKDAQGSVLFVLAVLVLTSGTIFAAYMTVPSDNATRSEFHRLRSDAYRFRRAEQAHVDIVAGAGAKGLRRALEIDRNNDAIRNIEAVDNATGRASGSEKRTEQEVLIDVTHIKAGTKVKGSISDVGDIKISGRIEGDCVCERVIITESGVVTGCVIAKWALIEGEVDGNVEVSDIHIMAGAQLKGDVRYENIELENGAVLEAACTRVATATVVG